MEKDRANRKDFISEHKRPIGRYVCRECFTIFDVRGTNKCKGIYVYCPICRKPNHTENAMTFKF